MSIKFGSTFTQRGGWWVVAQAGLLAAIFLALRQNRAATTPWQVLGWVLVMAAVALAGSGLWAIRRKLTAMPAPLDGSVLLDRGPYSMVRHPIYGGLILGLLGLSVKGGNVTAALVSLALIPFFTLKSRHEERLLAAVFPDYEDYRRRVRFRFLPWII